MMTGVERQKEKGAEMVPVDPSLAMETTLDSGISPDVQGQFGSILLIVSINIRSQG